MEYFLLQRDEKNVVPKGTNTLIMDIHNSIYGYP